VVGLPVLRQGFSRMPRTVDLASLPHVPTTCVHDLAGRLHCQKCRKAGKRPPAELRQLTNSGGMIRK
jgi:hypothetical protein